MPAFLVVVRGLPAQAIELSRGSVTIGRAEDAGVVLAHPEISRHHCRITWDGNVAAIEDLGSTRGTSVNGARIYTLTALNAGDKVEIGPTTLRFQIGDAPIAEESAPAAPVAKSVIFKGAPADRIPVTAEFTIGRDASCDIVLGDPGVSRKHAMVKPRPGGGCVVADLNSSGGSFVNGRRFDEHEFTVGDRLQIGPFCFQFDGHSLVRVANSQGGSIHAAGVVSRFGTQTILNEVTLAIPPSRFVGIIGPSGAGKSSLLQALAGLRKPTGGRILADGHDIYATSGPQPFGYVPQDDIVHPELTVVQALRFAARLRLSKDTPRLELQKLLVQTMDQLGLRERADLPISRLSGGQRKRVSVGVELLAKPPILFLDEPSSGLDPATEAQLMELLRELTNTGCTIICTTHVLEHAYLFDELIVLCGGGLAYQGAPAEARTYFEVPKLPLLYDRLGDRPAAEWRKAWDTKAKELPAAEESERKAPREKTRRGLALPVLLSRQWTILSSDWRNFIILAGQPLVIAALVCWVTDDRSMVMFFGYLATMWFGCSNAAQEIVKEIAIYRRERLVGVGAHSYLLSKFGFLTVLTALQGLVLYGAVLAFERKLDGSVAWQLAALAGTALASVGIGSAISSFSRSVMQAVMIVPLILIPMIIFSGHPVPVSDMEPSVLRVSRLMPSFSAQTVMDTSFLWKKQLTGDVMSDHSQSYRNLDPDRELTSRDVYEKKRPAIWALAGHGFWAIGTYIAAWIALRRRERN